MATVFPPVPIFRSPAGIPARFRASRPRLAYPSGQAVSFYPLDSDYGANGLATLSPARHSARRQTRPTCQNAGAEDRAADRAFASISTGGGPSTFPIGRCRAVAACSTRVAVSGIQNSRTHPRRASRRRATSVATYRNRVGILFRERRYREMRTFKFTAPMNLIGGSAPLAGYRKYPDRNRLWAAIAALISADAISLFFIGRPDAAPTTTSEV